MHRGVVRRVRASVALFAVAVTLVACGGGTGDLPPGVAAASGEAPGLSGPTLDGGRLPDLAGRTLVVSFWNPYCAPCRVEAPALQAASERYASRGVTVVGVHYTGEQWPKSVRAALSFRRAAHLTYPVIADPGSSLAAAFGIRGIPTTVIVDPSGRMRFRVLGRLRAAVLDDLVRRVLASPGPGATRS